MISTRTTQSFVELATGKGVIINYGEVGLQNGSLGGYKTGGGGASEVLPLQKGERPEKF